MLFFATAVSAFALVGLSSGADIAGWTGRGCTGSSLICANIVENRCCSPFSQAVITIDWTLPGSSRGFAYLATSCASGQTGAVFGPRTSECFYYNNNVLKSAKWVYGTGFSAKFKRDNVEECDKPNVYAYHDAEGKQIWKEIPKDSVDKVIDAFDKGHVEGAEQWKTYKVVEAPTSLVETRVETV